MKHSSYPALLLAILAAFVALPLVGCTGDGPQPVMSPMRAVTTLTTPPLAWADEFNGTSLDTTKWNIEEGYGEGGWGNDEWQFYTDDPSNLRVTGGELIITARSNGTYGKRDGSITSARITTENKLNVRYGTISARIKVPESEATWPAFWGLGANFRSVGWPRCGEIDIMEILNRFSDGYTTHSTVHWWNEDKYPPNPNPADPPLWDFVGGSRTFGEPLSDDYHVYEAERTAENIIFRIDGITVFVLPIDMTMQELADYFFQLLNVAVGGTHGADPNASNFSTPQEMRVDWVRVHAHDGEWFDPPDPSTTHRGIYSETHTNPMLPPNGIINTIDWSADWAASDPMSTDVPPREGVYSMGIDYQDFGAWGGGPVLQFAGADFTQFAGLTTYNTLVFSIDTSALTGFYDIGVEIQDTQGANGTAALRLKNYAPEVDGDWNTYAIPLADFKAANATTDLTKVVYLMYLTPVDASGNKVPGDFYLDDIHLADYSTTERGIFSEQYMNPAFETRAFSTEDWSSSPSDVNTQSTEVAPFEGSYVLTVDYGGSGDGAWGGVGFEFADVDFTAFSTLTTYNALVFSLNTAGFAAFDDLTVEIQDSAAGSQVSLASYPPTVDGDWSTYELPLSAFAGADLTKVRNLLFINPVDGGGAAVPGKFHLDDIHLATRTFAPPPPPGNAGIYTETYTNPLLPSTITTNAILGWGGSGSTLTVDSTAVTPVEGAYVLTYDHFADGDAWGGVVFEFSITDFTGGGMYDRLVFSLNTAGFIGFDDLQVELQDDDGAGAPLLLSKYTPQINGDWHTYEIPFTDFSAAQTAFDIDKVLRLLFFNPADSTDALIPGVFHLDHIYLAKPAAPPPPPPQAGPAGIYTETHTNPLLQSTVTTNAILGWGGSGSTLTVDSTAVTPFEGTYVLTYDHFADGDKWGGVVFEFSVIDFTDGGTYDRLVFSLNTAGFTAFDDLQVELQDDDGSGAPLLLSAYTPEISGDWHTYEIPFADFSAAQAAFDIGKVLRLLFFNPVDASDDLVPGTFHIDNIYLDSAPSAGFTGIYSETYTNPMVQNILVSTSALLGWGGSGSTLTVDSTAVTAAEGTYVITYDHFADGDKWGGVVFEFSITDFTDGGNQDRLVFSLNTAGYTGFDDLQVELQDDEGTGAPLLLSKYTPQISGDWHTYEIPFTDFSGAQTLFDIDKVQRLLFFNPADSTDAFIPGVFHLDHIYLR